MKEYDAEIKAFNTRFYPAHKRGRAARYYNGGTLDRLRNAHVTIFTPWGPRYHWETRGIAISDTDKETKAIRYLANVFKGLNAVLPSRNFQWVFLGADSYGTRINQLPEKVVAEYFANLRSVLANILPVAKLKLWSEFHDAAEPHRQEIRASFDDIFPQKVIWRAKETAKRMDRGGDHRAYLVERLAETRLIEALYQPIKVSLVARHKDNYVDGELPRLYIVPKHLHAPWL